MAKSRYEYVKQFELSDEALPGTWMVVRIDGRGFHGFTDMHNFDKPNDLKAIGLMNKAAIEVVKNIRDIIIAYGQSDEYRWRQALCILAELGHINNLYNTTFWAIVHSGKSEQEAEEKLRGTFSKDKHEILYTEFNINYNALAPVYRKGSVIIRQETEVKSISPKTGEEVVRLKRLPVVIHDDIIGDQFWKHHPELLASSSE
ncbi:unnamed protein product [Umbelopsis vinacea]